MLVIICGKKGAGKSVALEIIHQAGYQVFSTDQWIKEIYQVGEVGYHVIKNNLGDEFVNEHGVNKQKLIEWIAFSHDPVSNLNPNLIKLNNLILPLIKKRLVQLYHQYSLDNVLFVELAIYINHREFFGDIADEVIYINQRASEQLPGQAGYYLSNYIHPTWHVLNNNSSISDYKTQLMSLVDAIIAHHLQHKLHVHQPE